jgi:hypothetical protein
MAASNFIRAEMADPNSSLANPARPWWRQAEELYESGPIQTSVGHLVDWALADEQGPIERSVRHLAKKAKDVFIEEERPPQPTPSDEERLPKAPPPPPPPPPQRNPSALFAAGPVERTMRRAWDGLFHGEEMRVVYSRPSRGRTVAGAAAAAGAVGVAGAGGDAAEAAVSAAVAKAAAAPASRSPIIFARAPHAVKEGEREKRDEARDERRRQRHERREHAKSKSSSGRSEGRRPSSSGMEVVPTAEASAAAAGSPSKGGVFMPVLASFSPSVGALGFRGTVPLAKIREGVDSMIDDLTQGSAKMPIEPVPPVRPSPSRSTRAKIKAQKLLRRSKANRVHITTREGTLAALPPNLLAHERAASSRATTPCSSSSVSSYAGEPFAGEVRLVVDEPPSLSASPGTRALADGGPSAAALTEWMLGGSGSSDEARSGEDEGDFSGSELGTDDEILSRTGSEWSRHAWIEGSEVSGIMDASDLSTLRSSGRLPRLRKGASAVLPTKENRIKASAFMHERGAAAVHKAVVVRDKAAERREAATAVIKRHAAAKKRAMAARGQKAGHVVRGRAGHVAAAARGGAGHVADKAGHVAAAARDKASQVRARASDKLGSASDLRREVAQAVLRNHVKRWKERRAERRASGGDAGSSRPRRSRSFSLRKRRNSHGHTRKSSRSPPSPTTRPASQSPPPDGFGSSQRLFAPAELTLARQMCADWNRAPADQPKADLIFDKNSIKVWRWRGEPGPGGAAVDEYESQYELPVSIESFLEMQVEVEERKSWDATTRHVECLRAEGPTECQYLHKQTGDEMYLLWITESPWPLRDREYILHRRMCKLLAAPTEATGTGGPELVLKIETANDGAETRALRPTVAPKCVRAIDQRSVTVRVLGLRATRTAARRAPTAAHRPPPRSATVRLTWRARRARR